MNLPTEGDDLSLTHRFAKKFVATCFPDEKPFFEVLWASFQGSVADGDRLPTGGGPDWAGLGFGGNDGTALATPFALMLTHTVFCELRARGFAADPGRIRAAVVSCAKALGADGKLARQVVKKAGPEMEKFFRQLAAEIPVATEQVQPGRDSCFVEMLTEMSLTGPEERSVGKLDSLRSKKFDLVIDELKNEVSCAGGNKNWKDAIAGASAMACGTLWLVLTHIGSYVTHEEIRELFAQPESNTSIYMYRLLLGKLIGEDLRDRVMEQGSGGIYQIPKEGWTMLWIRRERDRGQSVLRRNIRRRASR